MHRPTTDPLGSPDFVITFAPVGNTPMPLCRDLPRRLLGIWAHPDDEAYLSAGLMGRTTDHGGQVTVVTATRGERGTPDPAQAGTAGFAARRERELIASLAELGVNDLRFLGLGDGECAAHDPAGPVADLADVIAEVRPDLIVTFGPDGITWHPDHRAVSSWTTAAWRRAGKPGDLLYAAITSDFARTHQALHERLGVFAEYGPGHPAVTPSSQLALECSLERTELARKRRALARHASQTDALAALVGEEVYLEWWRDETFRSPTAAEVSAADRPERRHDLAGLAR